MKQRCNNPNDPSYRYYGGAGIKVCEEWGTFDRFYSDMGERPEGTTLDRIDSSKDYEPSNCRWANSLTQRINQKPRKNLSGFTGVRQRYNKYEASTKVNYKYHYIGLFDTPEEAHHAYLSYRIEVQK